MKETPEAVDKAGFQVRVTLEIGLHPQTVLLSLFLCCFLVSFHTLMLSYRHCLLWFFSSVHSTDSVCCSYANCEEMFLHFLSLSKLYSYSNLS